MSMRKIREVLRLTHELGLSVRDVCEATGVGKTAVCEYVNRARVIGITWPIPPLIDDAGLERRLFTPAGFHAGSTKPLPDWTKVHEELKRRSVTLMILWEEHRAEHVDGHGYSRFCELYRAWEGVCRRRCGRPTSPATSCSSTTRRHGTDHRRVDRRGAEAHFFVAALGASNYTYAEATLDAGPGRLDRLAHARLRLSSAACRAMLVPDNLKSGITKPCFYEPAVNRTYAEMAAHTTPPCCRRGPYKPRDKTSVSYCTSFGLLRGDTIQPCWMRAAPTMALDDLQAWRDVPKPTSKAV